MEKPRTRWSSSSDAIITPFAGSHVQASDQPQHDDNDQYHTENAAKSGPAISVIAMIATKAAEQQDHQDNN
jgi:hypothetical protein